MWNEKNLYNKFKSLKDYRDRLSYFDKHFGILPFKFPDFNPSLDLFLTGAGVQLLNDLHIRERTSAYKPTRVFSTGDNEFTISVVPINSNRQAYNAYLLNNFLVKDGSFQQVEKKIRMMGIKSSLMLEKRHQEAIQKLQYIELIVKDISERSNRRMFMTVFYEGYNDSALKSVKYFYYKKRNLELYLYAQGILFRKYIELLSEQHILAKTAGEITTLRKDQKISLTEKLKILKDLGIIELIKRRYSGMVKKNNDEKILNLVCRIAGEKKEMREIIRKFIV